MNVFRGSSKKPDDARRLNILAVFHQYFCTALSRERSRLYSWTALAAFLVCAAPIAASAQVSNSAGPTPPSGAMPPPAALGGCVYIPPGFTLSPSLSAVGLTCGANGGLNVNILTGGGGGGGGSGAITAPLGSNTKANSVSTTFATDFLGQATMAGSLPVTIASNQPSLPVTVGNFPATQPVSGSVSVSNFPATQTVSGSVSVGNFPSTQAVTGTFFQTTQPVSKADGSDVTLGLKADTASAAVGSSLMAIERQLHADLIASTPTGTNTIGAVNQGTGGSSAWKVDGSSVTQPVSAASLPLPTGAATSANQPSNAAQGSTTSGQTGVLTQCAVLTGAPSYTTAQTQPCTLTVAGAIRTDSSATTQPISGTVTVNQTTPGITNAVANTYYYAPATISLGSAGFGNPRIDAAGNTKTSETGSSDPFTAITPVVTQSGTSAVGKASQGNLFSAYATNLTTTAGYLVLINATSVPTSGTAITPLDEAPIAASMNYTATINLGSGPGNGYSTGIVALITTSLTTYTPGGNAWIQVRVR